jgi:hypothetical protein
MSCFPSQPDDVGDDDLSDLEDFIVTNPKRDYALFIQDHFPMACEDDDDEEEDDEDEKIGSLNEKNG